MGIMSHLRRKGYYWRFFVAVFSLMLLPTVLMFVLRLEKEEVVLVEEINPRSYQDILDFRDTLIVPTIYSNIEVLDSLEGDELKSTFIEIMLPAVLIAKHSIETDRKKIMRLLKKHKWDMEDSTLYRGLMEEYKASNSDDLILRMATHPNSIVLAQAAIESGWGRSRFCKEANNVFGIWSYNEDEPRIQAQFSRGDQPIYLRKYDDLSRSIEDYFKVISKARAYDSFREKMKLTDDPYELSEHLVYYSEKRWEYVRQLKTIIRRNNFQEYDRYRIHPDYLKKKLSIH